ncbi:MAG: FlhB domain protein [Sporomusa sp.]|nr:FlhB domain protein [Sporomusa sp.]
MIVTDLFLLGKTRPIVISVGHRGEDRVTEPERDKLSKAVALTYDEHENNAPRVVAKGTGVVAGKILSSAKEHGIPIYQNKTLTGMLMAVELDREVPPELYQAVAEVLAYIYRLDQRLGKKV